MIIARHTYDDGSMVGFDEESGQWVPLDAEAEGGGFLGNVLSGARRGFQSLGQGIQQLSSEDTEADALERAMLGEEQAAASRSAPWAEAIGGAAPDIAAGVGLGAVTGGAGLPAFIASEAGLGATLGFLRPGSMEERMVQAAWGSAAGAAGGGLGMIALKGVGLGLKAAQAITGRSASRVGQAIDQGAQRVAAAEAPPVRGSTLGSRSAGAAETAADELDPVIREQTEALEGTEQAGQMVTDKSWERIRSKALELGMQEPLSSGTRQGSMARMLAAGQEATLGEDMWSMSVKAGNQQRVANKLAQALDIPGWNSAKLPKNSIFGEDLEDARALIGEKFRKIERRLPNMEAKDFIDAMSGIEQVGGFFGKLRGQNMIENAVEDAQTTGRSLGGKEIMQQMQYLSDAMATAYNTGEKATGDVLNEALNRLYDKIDDIAANSNVNTAWKKARQQWQILLAAERPGAISPEGDINPRTILGALSKPAAKGGWGKGGSGAERGSPAAELFTMLQFQNATNTNIPMTGARLGMRLARPLVQGGLLGAAGAAGLYGAGGLLK